eukprot:jgi/Chrzof1/5459/Cz16g04050.t1
MATSDRTHSAGDALIDLITQEHVRRHDYATDREADPAKRLRAYMNLIRKSGISLPLSDSTDPGALFEYQNVVDRSSSHAPQTLMHVGSSYAPDDVRLLRAAEAVRQAHWHLKQPTGFAGLSRDPSLLTLISHSIPEVFVKALSVSSTPFMIPATNEAVPLINELSP